MTGTTTATFALSTAHGRTAGERKAVGGGVICPICRQGKLRMEREPLTGQTWEECDSCRYRARHRSGDFQEFIAIRLPASKPPKRRRNRPPRHGA